MTMDYRKKIQIQSALLDSSAAAAVAALLYHHPGFFNPWKVSLQLWVMGGLATRVAINFYDHLVVYAVDSIFAQNYLPTRTTGKPVRYVALDAQSFVFLTINAVHEWIFVQRLCHYIWYSPKISLLLEDIGLWNTVGALWVMFLVLDTVYAPCHHILHMPKFYPLVHKHHHRQHYPVRGYLDAGNEHPIEHIIGVGCTWAAVLTAVTICRAHAAVIFLFFNIHAALAMLNHSPYDVEFDIIPFGMLRYSVANHEMHHRKFTVNYAQYSMWYDHLMKTFAHYEGPVVLTKASKQL
jgi:sterol desaturase/sphingolipid hydroxylase (fatty acid hydroxylase superfamily)